MTSSTEEQPKVLINADFSEGNSVDIANDRPRRIPTTSKSPGPDSNVSDDNIIGSSEALAKAISTMLATVIRDFDSKAQEASRSQDKLFSTFDRLTAELDQLLEDAPLPFIMQHAAKLSNVRKRVSSLNSLLRSVQRRLDNIDRIMCIGLPNNKSHIGGS